MSDAGENEEKKTVRQHEIVLGGNRLFKSVDCFEIRYGVAETQIKKWEAMGSPKPLKVGSRRYYEREPFEAWLLTLV